MNEKGYNPYQRRVSAGYRDGGRWTATGLSSEGPSAERRRQSINRTKRPMPIKKPKPLKRLPSGKPVKPRMVSQSELDRLRAADKPLESVYPLENIAGLGVLGRILLPRALREVTQIVAGIRSTRQSTARIQRAAKAIEEFLGGAPKNIGRNSKGDLYMTRGDKKVRFNIEDSHGRPEHYHLEVGKVDMRGKMQYTDAVPGKHIIPFKQGK